MSRDAAGTSACATAETSGIAQRDLTGSCGASREPQLGSPRLHRLNAECDVLFQRDAELLRALDDILPADATREGFVLGFLLRFYDNLLMKHSFDHSTKNS